MKHHSKSTQWVPYVFVVAIFIALISPYLLTYGMFMDGTIYAAISKNLAVGSGSFWSLKFMNNHFNPFLEHPPLAIYLESLFFRLFGDYFFIEKIYSCFTYCISGFLIHFIWKEATLVFKMDQKRSWIPLLLWILFPLVSWVAVNNMLENTMTVFVLLSLLFLFKSLQNSLVFEVLAGLSLSAAFMSKGPIGLYLWSFYFFYYLIYQHQSFGKMCLKTVLLIFYTIIPFIFLYLFYPLGFQSLMNYFDHQVIRSIASVTTVSNRFFILWSLVQQLILPFGIGFIWIIIYRFTKDKSISSKLSLKPSFLFFLIGLSGVLPVMMSLKQSGFYILTTFPFFAFSIAFLLTQLPKIVVPKIYHKVFALFALLLLLSSIVFTASKFGSYNRDKDKITDLMVVKKEIPQIQDLNIERSMWDDWALFGYASRYANFSFWREEEPTKQYLLVPKGEDYTKEVVGYKLVALKLSNYNLFIRIK